MEVELAATVATGLLPSLPSVEFKFSSLLVSSSKTLFLERSLCTIGEGCVGFKSKLNLFKAIDELAEEDPEAELIALEGGAISALLGTEEAEAAAAVAAGFVAALLDAVAGLAETGVAGVCWLGVPEATL